MVGGASARRLTEATSPVEVPEDVDHDELAVVVGNSRAVSKALLKWVAVSQERRQWAHMVESYLTSRNTSITGRHSTHTEQRPASARRERGAVAKALAKWMYVHQRVKERVAKRAGMKQLRKHCLRASSCGMTL